MDEMDKLIKQRAHMLIFAGLAFALWQGFFLMADLTARGSQLNQVAAFGTTVGALLWAAAMVGFIIFWRKVAAEKTNSSLEDELVQRNRIQAFANGFFLLIAAVFLGNGAETLWPGNAAAALRIAQIIGVTVPMIMFARLELKDLKGA